jgi:hypothetical protein
MGTPKRMTERRPFLTSGARNASRRLMPHLAKERKKARSMQIDARRHPTEGVPLLARKGSNEELGIGIVGDEDGILQHIPATDHGEPDSAVARETPTL